LNRNVAPLLAYRPAERASALAKLVRFAAGDEFKPLHKESLSLFWDEWLVEEPDDELAAVIKSESVNIAYHSWFTYDFEVHGGQTVIDLFLDR
jgi:hypothetical protein